MSAKNDSRMGYNPLEGAEPESYPETVIPKPTVQRPEAERARKDRPARRKWAPRRKHPDDPDDRTRHSYYVGDWVHNRLKTLARKYDVPVSDLARYLLREGIERLESGELDLETLEVVMRKLV